MRAPDFARTVDIHRKPGYDPAELFLDPSLRLPRLHLARRLLQKRLGMRYLMDVVPLDPSLVKGSHGAVPEAMEDWPLLASREAKLSPDGRLRAAGVRDVLLRHLSPPPR